MFNHDAFARDDHATDQRELADAACPGSIGFGWCSCCPRQDFLIEDDDGVRVCTRCAAELIIAVRAGAFGEAV